MPRSPVEGTVHAVLGYVAEIPEGGEARQIDVIAASGLSKGAVSGATARLLDRGDVERVARGRYRATAQGLRTLARWDAAAEWDEVAS